MTEDSQRERLRELTVHEGYSRSIHTSCLFGKELQLELSLNSLEKAAEHARNDLESDMLLLDVKMQDPECQCSESDGPQSGISMGSESLQFRQKLQLSISDRLSYRLHCFYNALALKPLLE